MTFFPTVFMVIFFFARTRYESVIPKLQTSSFKQRHFWKPIYSNGFFWRSKEFVRRQHLKELETLKVSQSIIIVTTDGADWPRGTVSQFFLPETKEPLLLKGKIVLSMSQKCAELVEPPYFSELQWISFFSNIFKCSRFTRKMIKLLSKSLKFSRHRM